MTNDNAKIQEEVFKTMGQYFEQEKRKTIERYKQLNSNVKKNQILFVGSSLMEQFPINEMQLNMNLDKIIYNRGVSGSVTKELLENLDTCIFDLEPSKIFINIGTNDIGALDSGEYKVESLINNYEKILKQISERLPNCDVNVMAYYPINSQDDFGLNPQMKHMMFLTRTNENIRVANEKVRELSDKYKFNYIDVSDGLYNEVGNLKKEFSVEGVHLWPNAYTVIIDNIKSHL